MIFDYFSALLIVYGYKYNCVYMLGRFKCLDCVVNFCFHWLISRWIVLFRYYSLANFCMYELVLEEF